jgi:anthraniloyl-CoA monooxygenase
VRNEYADVFRPDIDMRECKFVWLGTHQKFDDAFTFIFEKTAHGWVWAHAYQFDDDTATFIVEMQQDTWDACGVRGHVEGRGGRNLPQDLRAASGRA